MKRNWTIVALALAVIVAAACARNGKPASAAEVVLEIYNAEARPLDVALISGGQTTRLGTVTAGDTRRWAIPRAGSKRVHVVAADSTGREASSTDLDISQGQVVRWEIRQ